MDMESVKFGFQVLQFIATGCVGFYVYMSNKDKVTNDRISGLEDDIETTLHTHGERLSTLEQAIKNAPSHRDLGDVYSEIHGVGRNVSDLSGRIEGMQNTLNLIHEKLLRDK